jgi:hypothetical protein
MVSKLASRCHDAVMAEPPGGSVGCDVCGFLLDATKVSVHDAWHRLEDERFDRLTRALEELLDLVRGGQTEPAS